MGISSFINALGTRKLLASAGVLPALALVSSIIITAGPAHGAVNLTTLDGTDSTTLTTTAFGVDLVAQFDFEVLDFDFDDDPTKWQIKLTVTNNTSDPFSDDNRITAFAWSTDPEVMLVDFQNDATNDETWTDQVPPQDTNLPGLNGQGNPFAVCIVLNNCGGGGAGGGGIFEEGDSEMFTFVVMADMDLESLTFGPIAVRFQGIGPGGDGSIAFVPLPASGLLLLAGVGGLGFAGWRRKKA